MPPRAEAGHVEQLAQARFSELRELMSDPAASCFAEARLFGVRGEADDWGRPAVLGYAWGGRLTSAVMLGANLVPIRTDPGSRRAFAEALIRMGRRCSSIVGPAQEVLPLWELLEPAWGPAREVRPEQPLLALSGHAAIAADPLVAPVPPHRLAAYLPASVAMFTEEVGVDPRLGGMDELYRQRVADLLRTGRAFAHWEAQRVLFKAELGAVTTRAVQVQGVWVDPAHRGMGLAAPGMAAVVEYALRVAPLVTLYVNAFNAPALATYATVGFQRAGMFATVLF